MNLLVLTDEPFPYGGAATNRILSYSKGIVALGRSVTIICLRPTERDTDKLSNTIVKGIYDGVLFEYASGTAKWPDNKLKKLYLLARGIIGAIANVRRSKIRDKNTIILLCSNQAFHMAIFFLVSRLFDVVYLQEKSEYPFVLNCKTFFGRMYARLYVNYFYKFFDGMIVMTKPLMEYFTSLVRKDARLLHVPMTVEPERFLLDKRRDYSSDYVAYCGDMSGNKDGVPILIEAFGMISSKYPGLKLYLIGPTGRNADYEHLIHIVKRHNLEHRVMFTGRVSREEIPDYLVNAKMLALARPSGLQAAGGFPTKLGEYLCTANPVVLTKVGEIPSYLEHRVHAFLCQPDDPRAFADQMDAALCDPEFAAHVGQEGRALALKVFDYRAQSKRMIEFFESFSRGKSSMKSDFLLHRFPGEHR